MFAARSYKNYGAFNDPYFNNTSLLLHGDGTNGAQNNTFIDSSSNNFTITRTGAATQGSFIPYPLNGSAYDPLINGGSGYFPKNAGEIRVANNESLNFGTESFTIEFWIYPEISGRVITKRNDAGTGTGTWGITWSSNFVYMYSLQSSAEPIIIGPSPADSVPINQWTHVAITRNGSAMSMWINGQQVVSSTSSYNFSTTQILRIPFTTRNEGFSGYLSDVRMVKGASVYTSNFNVPQTPLTNISNTSLLCNFTNAGIFDNTTKNNIVTVGNSQISTAVKKYGTGSIAFDGAGDELTIPQNAVFQFGTGDFTIECWVYCTNLSGGTGGAMQLIDFRASTSSEVRPVFGISGGTFYYYTAGAIRISSGSILTNTWYHVAVSRVSGTTRMFVNGTKVGVDYVDSNSYLISAPIIGSAGSWVSGYDFVGYMDDIRITKGVGRYAANFTPPQQAFPNQ
jgi:hypothetical protein